MDILINALVYCVVFLILLGLSLWPVLAKNSKRRKMVLILGNVIFVIGVLAVGSAWGNNRQTLISKQVTFYNNLKYAAELLEREKVEGQKYELVPADEPDLENALETALKIGDSFQKQCKALQAGKSDVVPLAPAKNESGALDKPDKVEPEKAENGGQAK